MAAPSSTAMTSSAWEIGKANATVPTPRSCRVADPAAYRRAAASGLSVPRPTRAIDFAEPNIAGIRLTSSRAPENPMLRSADSRRSASSPDTDTVRWSVAPPGVGDTATMSTSTSRLRADTDDTVSFGTGIWPCYLRPRRPLSASQDLVICSLSAWSEHHGSSRRPEALRVELDDEFFRRAVRTRPRRG